MVSFMAIKFYEIALSNRLKQVEIAPKRFECFAVFIRCSNRLFFE